MIISAIEKRISAEIRESVLEAASKFVCESVLPKNTRGYECSASSCSKMAYAKGLCNGNYLRHRKGYSLESPIKHRRRAPHCITCGKETNSKGGWMRCTAHYKARRRNSIKAVIIDLFGGKCMLCEQSFPVCVYDFHHVGEKDKPVSPLISSGSPSEIAKEIIKCVLLCANCHRMEHFNDNDVW